MIKRFVILSVIASVLGVFGEENQLTPEEKKAGWKLLFDGKTTKGWHSFGQPSFPEKGWIVREGNLELQAGSKAGDIVSAEEFLDFDLSWEWKLERAGN